MKKLLLSFILLIVGFGMANADEPIKGIIATYDGADTSYKLEEVPTIKYEVVGGVNHAVFYLKDKAEPVFSVVLAEGKLLEIVYGIYTPAGINSVISDKVSITEHAGRKIINGGKLIIIGKDGKIYNAVGVEIKE
ncbi:MAG: hypothetical protein KBS94_08955 [Prevotella sp.]|nr:hypothetical protein [Candidatus Equicola faecalis]